MLRIQPCQHLICFSVQNLQTIPSLFTRQITRESYGMTEVKELVPGGESISVNKNNRCGNTTEIVGLKINPIKSPFVPFKYVLSSWFTLFYPGDECDLFQKLYSVPALRLSCSHTGGRSRLIVLATGQRQNVFFIVCCIIIFFLPLPTIIVLVRVALITVLCGGFVRQ